MNRTLVLSILSDDKPGVVEALASTISENGGNWLESSMTNLAGKFAGILQVNISDAQLAILESALAQLEQQGIQVTSAVVTDTNTDAAANIKQYQFSLMGNDRPGIVKELAQAFSSHHINLEELDTTCGSMPWSGEPMFHAQGLISVPTHIDMDSVSEQLDEIADELGVDIELQETEVPTPTS